MKKKILQLCLALVLGLTVSFAVVGCNPTTPEIEVSGVQRVFDLGSSFSLGQNAVVNKVQDGKTTALKSGEYTVTQNFDGQKQGVYTVTVTLQKDVSYAYDVAVVDLDGFSAKEGQVLSEIALPFSQLAWKTPSASVGSVGSNSHAVVFNASKGGSAEFNVQVTVSAASAVNQNSWKVQPSIEGWTYGEAAKVPAGTAQFGTVVFEYYSDESLSAESKLDGAPVNAGTYWLVAKVAAGEDYTSLTSAAVEFTVAKANNSWTTQPSIEDWAYGQQASQPAGAATYGTVVFEYYSDESLSAESKLDGVPANAGTYWLVAKVEEGEDYTSLTSSVEFVIAKATNSWTIQPSIEGWTYGEAANAPVGTAQFGTVVFEYYSDPNLSEASKLDGTPEDAGEYWIKAKVPESQNYNALEKYVVMLRIEKADVKVQQGPDAASANIGSLLSSVGINGGKVVFEKTNASGAVESVEVSGTWSWIEPQLEVTSTRNYAVAFTPDSPNFNKVYYSVMVQAVVPDGVSAIAKFGDAFSDSVTFVGNGTVYNATVPFGISQIRVILSSSQGGFREYRVGTGNVWNEWQQFSPSSYIVDLTFAETDYTKNHSVQAVTFYDETYTFNISFEAPLTLTVNGVKKPLSTVVDLDNSVVVSVSEGYTVRQSGIDGFSFDNAYVIKSYDLDKQFLFEVTNTYGDFVLLSLNVANRFSQANINDAVWKLKPTGDNYFSYHYEYETLPSSIDVSFLVNPRLDKNHILRWKTNLSDKEFFMNGLQLNVPMYDGLNRIDIYVMEIFEDGNGYQQVSGYTITLSGQSVLEGFLAVTYDNSTHEFIKVPCDYDPETRVVTGLDFGYRFELQARFSSTMYAQRWETPDGTAYNFNDFGISNDVVLVVETSSGEVERIPITFIFNLPVLISDKNGDMVDATPNVSGDVAEFVVVQDVSQGPFTLTYGDKTVNLYETDGTPIENVYWEQKTDGKKVKFEILAGESDVFEGVVNFVQSTSPGAYIQQIIVYRTEKDRDDENFNCTSYSVSNYPLYLDLYQGETPDDMLKRIAIKTFSNNPFQIEGDGNIRIVKVYEMASVVCRLPIIFVEAGAATDEIRINAVKETNKNYVFEWYEVTEENFELQIYHNEEVSIYTSNGGVKIDIEKDGRLLFTNYGFFTIGSVSDATISENGVYTVTFTSSDKTVTKTVVMEISILAQEMLSLTDKNGESYSLFDDMSVSGDWEFRLTAPGEGMAYLPADIVDSDGKVTFSYVSEVMTMSIGGEMLVNGTLFTADTIAGSDGYNYVEAQLAVIGQTDAVINVKIVFNR